MFSQERVFGLPYGNVKQLSGISLGMRPSRATESTACTTGIFFVERWLSLQAFGC